MGTAPSLVLGRAEGCSALGPELYHNRYVLFPPHPLTRRRTVATLFQVRDRLSRAWALTNQLSLLLALLPTCWYL